MVRLSFFSLFWALCGAAHAVQSTFDVDNEGWQTSNVSFSTGIADDFAPAIWFADVGNPGGALFTDDVSDWNFFAAPAKFLGDQSSMIGGTLSFDTKTTQADNEPYPAVVLMSGITSLFALSLGPPPAWTRTTISLVGAAWSTSPTSYLPASDAQLRAVLGNLDGLYIEADWYGRGNETTGLDNVRLQSVPEPASVAALGLGIAALRRRRR